MHWLLAQAEAPTIDVGDFEKWWHFGPLGVLGLLAATTVAMLIGVAAVWLYRVTIPHAVARKQIEIQREQKTLVLLDTLGEVVPKQAALAERLATRQESHHGVCERTDSNVREVLSIVRELQTP